MPWIDNWLNKITMYGFMLYFLVTLVVTSVVFAALGYLSYNPWLMLLNIAVFYGVSKLTNSLFARLFNVQANWESSAITGLILALIFGPDTPLGEIWKPAIVAAIAMLSKYVIVHDRWHLFNPAAFAAVVSAILLSFGASWWVGNLPMLPFVLIGGLLFLRKARWFHLSSSFIITYLVVQAGIYAYYGTPSADVPQYLLNIILYSPILFFGFVMLTEPLTMPGGRRPRIIYGSVVAVLAMLLPILFNIYYGFELSLLVANIFSLLMYGNTRRSLVFVSKQSIAANTMEFRFTANKKIQFKPGQFLLWTLPHKQTDMRGHRRYFSIASSPAEDHIAIVTKFADKSSSFKKALRELPEGRTVMAASLDGDFVLPKDTNQTCVFIAGGVGIAPFRSMIKDMLERKIRRPITLLYSNNNADEICFQELFDMAATALGVKIVYTLTDLDRLPSNWAGRTGYVNAAMIRDEVPNHQNALYYISGPDPMVRGMKRTVRGMEIASSQIKADYFPGYA